MKKQIQCDFPEINRSDYNYFRGQPFDSEGSGGGGGLHFLEINILTLKMLKIKNLSTSGKKKISDLKFPKIGGKCQNVLARSASSSQILK